MTDTETMLIPLEKYLKTGTHIGTKFRTKHAEKFIFKVNPDGLAILDVQQIDKRLETAGKFLAKYEPGEIVITGRRENVWRPIKAFAKVIGCKEYAGRYKAGVITNPNLNDFIEPKILIVTDPWLDKNAIHDAFETGIAIIGCIDSNNTLNNIDFAIPCNNKGDKAIGAILWVLANQYLKERGQIKKDLDIPLEKFYEE
jgi:small subunit ribosomal protein S2